MRLEPREEIDPTVRAMAGAYTAPRLRSLDAIHLATAQFVTMCGGVGLTGFVTYDEGLFKIAQEVGLPVVQPGSARNPGKETADE